MLKRTLPLFLILLLTLSSCGTQKSATESIFAMDTVMQFTVYGDGADNAISDISALISEYESVFSATREDSELFAINLEGGSDSLSPLFTDVLLSSVQFCEVTDGAFDPVLGNAIALWDNKIPDIDTLNNAVFGISNLSFNPNGVTCTLAPGASLNLGAIVKGAVSDAIYDLLQRNGTKSAMCILGGNIIAFGSNPEGKPWNIGVRDPNGDATDYLGVVSVSDRFVIASGDYERFFEIDGIRYHHILDPKTGAPAQNDLRSVTIVAQNGAMADAYSTALFVMGSEAALDFWRAQNNFEAILVLRDNTVIVTEGLDFKLHNEDYTYEVAYR